jgi:hypothetical protein
MSTLTTNEVVSAVTPPSGQSSIYPKIDGFWYSKDDTGSEMQLSNSGGDVVGPAVATDNSLAVYNGTTGKLLKNSTLKFDATNNRVGANITPLSTIHSGGSFGLKCVTKTANYIAADESIILVDATSADVTITLPPVAGIDDRIYKIKKIDSSANIVIIDGNASELIDGELTQRLILKSDEITLVACSGAWQIIAHVKNKPVAQLSSTVSQQPASTTPVAITMNVNDLLQGIDHSTSVNPSRVVVKKKGKYLVMAAAQIGKTSGVTNNNIDIYMKINGADVANSNTRSGLLIATDTSVLISQAILELNVGDYVETFLSISVTGQGAGIIATAPAGEPVIPSIIFTMYEV